MSSTDSCPEVEWRVCVGFPDYEISNRGDLRRLTTWKGAKAGTIKKAMLAHRLVALTFIGPQPTERHEVAHKDGSRTKNWDSNLRWSLPVDNQADRKKHGTFHHGELCASAKIADDDVSKIREAYAGGGVRYSGGSVTMSDLAKEYGVSLAQISRIINGHHRVATP